MLRRGFGVSRLRKTLHERVLAVGIEIVGDQSLSPECFAFIPHARSKHPEVVPGVVDCGGSRFSARYATRESTTVDSSGDVNLPAPGSLLSVGISSPLRASRGRPALCLIAATPALHVPRHSLNGSKGRLDGVGRRQVQ